jgi:sterol desaturase/sphingolipid hydroxylase (fatty acid hydroxylase superfamily)
LVYAIYLGLGIYVTKCNLGLGFLWKLDAVLGSYGLKKLRRRRKASGFKRERSE